ncbi:T9SS type A sorting domain-containing protein [Hymenobacter gummosus]|uniref:T9SS type A sorting domain-containing protein n=1 Tax=Hymenobacter gummosus TaxID=1776032 RepID=A0A431TVJ0_9BACT|nr:FG-GAP-like repeat-containing protein [Hymenobacter gummosus]RTQ45109.1 T9SS type A sorting domain-containing protein [Hymenobacter gummosus]
MRLHVRPRFFSTLIPTAVLLLAALSPRLGQGQTYTASITPSRHTTGALRATGIRVDFNHSQSASLNTSLVKVMSSQYEGRKAAAYALVGSRNQSNNRLNITPTNAFRAGELVTVVVPSAIATKQVLQFWTETTGGGSLASPTNYSSGTNPYGVAAADLNGDAYPDLVTANATGNTLTIRLNDGSGGFGSPLAYAGLSSPRAVAAADLDLDGDLDLVVAEHTPNQLRVLLNGGSGTSWTASALSTGASSGALAVAVADLSADTNPDLVVVSGNHTVSVLLGTGGGAFAPATSYAAGTGAQAVAAGDVDNDGDLDVLTANATAGTVSLLRGDNSGTLAAATTLAAGSGPQHLTLTDVNGDQYLDVVTANADGTASLLLNSNGSFAAATSLSVGTNASAVVAGDIDGDLDLDLLLTDYANNQVVLRLNDGSGSFAAPTTVAVGGNPRALTLVDVNADGAVDVLTANGSGNSASVVLNRIPAPELTSATPAAAAINSAVVVAGQYFTAVTGVTVNGVAATYTVNSPNQLTLTVPAGASSGLLRVTSSYGSGTLPFLVLPVVSSFTPSSGGENTTSVVLTGTGFVGVTAVKFNSVEATYTVNSSTQITATVPAGATTGPLSVTTAGGTGTSSSSFTVVPGISAFSPGSGAEGTSVALTGTQLADVTRVTFGGVATSFTIHSATSITATVPAGAVSGLIQVTSPSAGTRSSGSWFTVVPGITGFTPATGASGTSVVISGTSLSGATAVRFNGTDAASYTVHSAQQITAVVASGTASGYITVTTPQGTGTSSTVFALAPTLTSFSPSSGTAAANGVAATTVTLTGTNLLGTTAVMFNGVAAASFSVQSNTSLTATVPATALTGPITVTNAAGTATSATSFAPTPVLWFMSPGSGPVGTVVTLTGTNLGSLTAVRFNGVTSSGSTRTSATSLTAVVPPGATSGPVTAVVGGTTTSAPAHFQVRTATVLATTPARNAFGQALSTRPAATFSQAQASGATPAGLKVYSDKREGLRTGSLSGGGTYTSTLMPALPWQPGERVHATAPGAAGGVWQFRTAVTGTGNVLKNIGTVAAPALANGRIGSASGDVDGDGDLDLVVANSDATAVLRNDGGGSFSTWQTLSTIWADDVALADLDGDGDLDLVVGIQFSGQTVAGVAVYRNDGSGQFTFSSKCNVSGGCNFALLDVGDVDGDGDLDVATGNDDSASLCYNDGTGTLTAVRVVGEAGPEYGSLWPGPVLLRDVDADGDLDLLRGEGTSLVWYPNEGNGLMGSAASSFTVGSRIAHLLGEDFDGDGDVDVLVSCYSGVRFLLANDGTGQYTLRSQTNYTSIVTFACYAWADAGDVDGDGDLDVVAGSQQFANVAVLLNNGAGLLSLSRFVTQVAPSTGLLADFDGDNDLDLMAASYEDDEPMQICLNGRTPTITAFTPHGAVGATVTLAGTEFNNITGLTLNGTTVTSYTRVSSTQVTFTVPSGASTGRIGLTTPWGTATTGTDFTVVVPGSTTISGLSPGSGPVGTTVTITGTAFTGASSVTFNGVSAPFTLNSTTSITATVPATATTGPVEVTAAANTANSGINFIITPVVSSFSPGSGVTGSSVVITGTGLTGATDVAFNGVSATFTQNSATQLTATVPATATTGVLSVTTAGGTYTTTASFTVLPTLTSFAPSSGPEGTSVTITGTGLAGTTGASFNGTAVTTIAALGATSLTVLVPAGASTGPVSVTTTGGTASSTASFTVTSAVTAFSPTSGPTGTTVVISGTTLTGATAVTFGGVSATFTVNSATQITATVPTTALTGAIRVTTPTGMYTTTGAFAVLPTLATFTPGSGPEGTSVTISGSGLGGATTVSFSGTAATSFTVMSATSLTAVVPASATTGPITVTTPSGTGTSAGSFTVTPAVTAFSPASGPTGTTVVITGTTLTGATAVTVNGVSAPFTVNSATQLTATVPAGATTGLISLTTTLGTVSTATAFQVTPGVLAFSPASGPAGTSVLITGTTLTGATSVKFNGVSAPYTVNSDTQLTATVPAGASPGPLAVTTPSGPGSSAASFTVLFPVTAVTPAPHAVAAGRATNLVVTFPEPMAATTRAHVRVFGSQRQGRRSRTATVSGNSLTLDPGIDFKPGEQVSVTIPALAKNAGGAPATPYVWQFTTAAGAAPGGFGLRSTLSIGSSSQPTATALADLDGDGDLDLATAALTLNQVLVQLNTGGVGFGPATGYVTSNGPTDVTAADVDNDGDLDLLTVNLMADVASVLLNTGAGTFTSAAPVAVGQLPNKVVVADVNGDGWLDLLTANLSSSAPSVSVALNLGTGAGTFAAATTLSTTGTPYGLAVADLDLDGDLDLAVADHANGVVRLALNDGSGTFAFSGTTVAVGTWPVNVVLADVSGDGRADMLTSNNGAASLSVALATGAATFGTASSVSVPAGPYGLAAADVDGDGDLDLVTCHASSPGAVSVRLNNGSGTAFTGSGVATVGNGPFGLAVGDLDGDLALDLVTADRSGNSVSVLLNAAPPTFSSFTPTSGPEGTVVTITGTNLSTTSSVKFNGTAASFTVGSATQVTATVPAGATTGLISLTAAGNTVTSSGNFTVTPTLTSFTPTSGPAGTSVTITGTTLSGATSLTFNGAAATFTVNSATSLTATVPATATTGYLTVTTPSGSATSSSVFAVPPSLSGFTPASAVAGTVFTLTGLNFTGATAVSFNGTAASSFTVLSDTQLQATLPVGTASGTITVTTGVGTGTSPTSFTLLPSIYSFSPTSGPVGTRVYLAGDGFTGISGAAGVKVNGTNATSYVVTSTNALNAVVASGTTTGPLIVVTSAGTLTSSGSFTITPGTPTITSLSYTSGPVGTVINVLGGPFLPTGATAITGATVNGVSATFSRLTGSVMQVTVPAAASGTGYVTLTNASGTSQSGQTFTVLDIFSGSPDQCLTTTSISSTGSSTTLWQWLLAPNGQLVAAVQDQGHALGTVYAEYRLSSSPQRRDDSGVEYLDRNWHLVAQNTFAGQAVKVKFYGLNSEWTRLLAANDGDANDVTTLADLRLTQYAGSNENCALADNTAATSLRLLTPTGTESISGTNWFSVAATVDDHFSEFYLHGGAVALNAGSTPLPVELLGFAATRRPDGAVDLAWATAQERDAAGFVVERSLDGRAFADASALLPAAGTSTTLRRYAWRDAAAPAAQLYYRLRQVDTDGSVQYSPIAAVTAGPGAAWTLYPNPTRQQVTVSGLPAGEVVTLRDAVGRVLRRGTVPTNGSALILPLTGLPAGVYVVQAAGQTQRLAVE